MNKMYWKLLANMPKLFPDATDPDHDAKNSVVLIESFDLLFSHPNDLIPDFVEDLFYVDAMRSKQRRVIDQDLHLPWKYDTIIVYSFRRNLFDTIHTNGEIFPVPILFFDLEICDCSVKHRLSRYCTDRLSQALQNSHHVIFQIPLDEVSKAPI